MKIGVITFHCVHNYGAMLQAYALCKYINEQGLNCETIDYRPNYLYLYYDRISIVRLYKYFIETDRDNTLKAILKTIKHYKRRCYKDKRWRKFNHFLEFIINKSKNKYIKKQELHKTNYDVIICGSDQIWNSYYTNGIKPEYFGSFATKSKKVISYAASNGKSFFPIEEKAIVNNLLNNFTSISVREEGLQSFLIKETNKNISLVCDPVFLISKKAWESLIIPPQHRKYLLIYTFDEDNTIYDVALQYAKKLKLSIIQITDKKRNINKNIHQETQVGPLEFLGYIYHANYICTSSFHGVAFSIIFNKQFLCFPHKKFGERTQTLLEKTNLSSRNIYNVNQSIPNDIDYKSIGHGLHEYINKSKEFLMQNLL